MAPQARAPSSTLALELAHLTELEAKLRRQNQTIVAKILRLQACGILIPEQLLSSIRENPIQNGCIADREGTVERCTDLYSSHRLPTHPSPWCRKRGCEGPGSEERHQSVKSTNKAIIDKSMPPRRRPTQAAAALPASRLPLGTPQLSYSKSFASARSTSRSSPGPESQPSTSSTDKEGKTHLVQTPSDSDSPLNMPPKLTSDATVKMSTAATKLERQNKRNEEAEAALTGPARALTRRSKGTKWMPLDYTADISQDTQQHTLGSGVPLTVNEVRVNTFRPATAMSRETSLSRSMSALSQRSSQTGGPHEMDRHDSALAEQGFQIYKGRRTERAGNELNAYEDRPDERQTTVEATFDKREIYDVFGNALPGPEFISQNEGHKDGQLQFIQHPNGDISAHQWSQRRYIWENIGQFSNIRKKVEGQLASDRLKGQTAYQTLKQNTLAYFRTIAKQREANVMGLPFGAKEIQAAMPDLPKSEISAAPTGLKEVVKDFPPPVVSYSGVGSEAKSSPGEYLLKVTQETAKPTEPFNVFMPQSVPQAHRADRPSYGQNLRTQTARPDDPFLPAPTSHPGSPYYSASSSHPASAYYSASSYQQIYKGSQSANQHYNQTPQSATTGDRFLGATQRPSGLNYDYHFPAPGQGTRTRDTTRYITDTILPGPKNEATWQHTPGSRTSNATAAYQYPSYQHNNTYRASAADQNVHNCGAPTQEIAAPRPRHLPPSGRGTSMSDYLVKISESATERKLSQSNISRTVLYDPYQSPAARAKPEPSNEQEKQYESPAINFSRNVAGKGPQPPTRFDPTSSKFFPTGQAPKIMKRSSSPVATPGQTNAKQNSPAAFRSTKRQSPTAHLVATSILEPASQTSNDPFTSETHSSQPSSTETITTTTSFPDTARAADTRTYDEELKDWWYSGSKFARQQEFFDKIKAASLPPSSHTTALTPIGTAPARPPGLSAPFNETTTRLLIPVLEELSKYVEGPPEKRRDYFCQWSAPPEWCIDRSERGNDSFFDANWGQPPTRVARDPRYSNQRSWDNGLVRRGSRNSAAMAQGVRAVYGGGVSIAVGGPSGVGSGGLGRRFAFGGRF